MSFEIVRVRPADWSFDRRQRATGIGSIAMLGALALGLIRGIPPVFVVVVAVAGAALAAAVLGTPALRALHRNRALAVIVALVALAALWVVAGLHRAQGPPGPQLIGWPVAQGVRPYALLDSYWPGLAPGWPWQIGRLPLLPLVLTVACALGGMTLIADSVRVRLGLASLAPTQLAPWRLMTAPVQSRNRVALRAAPGVALIALAALLAIGLGDRYADGNSLLQAVVVVVVGGWAAALAGSPLLVGALMRVDRDEAARAREQERQRFAAHLHDSVLQTLALVQRQAHDPAAVVRLARRQEHALRAWMAGEAELASATLAAALREVVAEVEDEHRITIELTAIGDRPLDPRGEALVAAAREALRNAARHAPGAPVLVFAEIGAGGAEVFVRDEGPGFDPEAVADERRGIRDA
ncbi:MAG: sensor histidine kinase, partial [Solirubrobacteraceae bacterium]